MAKPPKSPSTNARDGAPGYPVGYGKPPKASQFQKGQSGNPGGASSKHRARMAAKKASPHDQIVLKEAERKVAINENGVRSEITTHEAAVRKLAIGAAKGDRSAQKQYFDQVQSALERQHKEKMARFGLLAQYVNQHVVAHGGTATLGVVPAWPHPDDVVLDYVDCVGEVVGPIDAKQAQPFIALVGDYHVWQARLAQVENMATQAEGEPPPLYTTAVATIEGLLDAVRQNLAPSFKAQLAPNEGGIPAETLEIADPGGGPINLAILSPEGADTLHALAVVSTLAANFEHDIRRRTKLNIAVNTISVINRLYIERQNREGGALPAPAAPEFGQFYDSFASPAQGDLDEAAP